MKKFVMTLAVFTVLNAGCAAHSEVREFRGLTTPYGKPIAHIHATRVAIHLFGRWRMIGNASIYKVTDDFLKIAKNSGATRFWIDDAERTSFWFGFVPFTLVLTPVASTISGDALE